MQNFDLGFVFDLLCTILNLVAKEKCHCSRDCFIRIIAGFISSPETIQGVVELS